jgi:hypothetical protein
MAVDMLEIRGLHLKEADLIAQTHDQSMRLLSKSKTSGVSLVKHPMPPKVLASSHPVT